MTRMRRPSLILCAAVVVLTIGGCFTPRNTIVVGSKNFPEQAILGELLAQQIEAKTGFHVERRFYLSGTYICHQALLAGRIDMYVEYTGTALTAILKEEPEKDPLAVFDRVRDEYARRFHLVVEPPLGFNDSFAIVIRGNEARQHNIRTISGASKYAAAWHPGFGYEFMERPDGYEGLINTYGLKFSTAPRIMDLNLLYRALLSHQVDVIAGNTTDGQLLTNDFTVLEDDKHYFPPYQAVTVVREEALSQYPALVQVLTDLRGKISDQDMQRMNYEVVGKRKDIAVVVRDFLHSAGFDSNTK
ncbi:MAG TPA: glycine betaine ABC transporter substrate-binding protein [Candidatus Acidoferrales bacterium]|nr:glycine betaine ABC transporter substrate-binding protein [Candidatus Acidoferrales bacterium]